MRGSIDWLDVAIHTIPTMAIVGLAGWFLGPAVAFLLLLVISVFWYVREVGQHDDEPDPFKWGIGSQAELYGPVVGGLLMLMIISMMTFVFVIFLPSPVEAHDWYTGLSNGAMQDCCGEQHCNPAFPGQVYINEEGNFSVIIEDGLVVDIEPGDGRILYDRSQDASVHVCLFPNQGVRCLILPPIF